jgi:hypothetical protein|tara:strand:- start:3496 stop:3807 length:312 start_codon:yes stop_codon:yes gene_type:complete
LDYFFGTTFSSFPPLLTSSADVEQSVDTASHVAHTLGAPVPERRPRFGCGYPLRAMGLFARRHKRAPSMGQPLLDQGDEGHTDILPPSPDSLPKSGADGFEVR